MKVMVSTLLQFRGEDNAEVVGVVWLYEILGMLVCCSHTISLPSGSYILVQASQQT